MIVDLHAHYPMHVLEPRRADTHAAVVAPWKGSPWRGWLLNILSRLFNYEGPSGEPSVTVDLLRQGEVGAVLSVLFEPFDEMDLAEPYAAPPKPHYFQNLVDQIDRVEKSLEGEARARVVRNPTDMDAALAADEIAFIHCIEGAFAVGADAQQMKDNVASLATRGVAYITLAHLFYRGVAQNAPAIPFMPDWLYRTVFPQKGDAGITPLGEACVRAMVDNRVLLDITHMNEKAIEHAFRLLDPATPVIASHIACRVGSAEYNLSDDTIREVGRRGGVMGVIVCEHWACDGPPPTPKTFEQSVEVVCTHINRIVDVTGSDDNVAIGSDLDGYIKPALHQLEHEGRMKELEAALVKEYGAERAKKFCSDNLLGLLRSYWRGDG
jgi:microsomal dipeptidase-like Zn-dependent dipeptidase